MKIIAIAIVFFTVGFSFIFLNDIAIGKETLIVVVNKSVMDERIDRETVSEIYKAEKSKWSNNDKITVAMLKTGSLHETFTKEVVGITIKKLIRIWKSVIFTGKGTPARVFRNEEALAEFVGTTKGAIGYIRASIDTENVKVIPILQGIEPQEH